MERLRRDSVAGLVRMQAEDRPPQQVRGAFLHHADAAVTVLDRPGKVADLERRAHRLVLTRRYLAAKYQGLGPAADAAVEGAHQSIPGGGVRQGFAAQLATAGRGHPEGAGLFRGRRQPIG